MNTEEGYLFQQTSDQIAKKEFCTQQPNRRLAHVLAYSKTQVHLANVARITERQRRLERVARSGYMARRYHSDEAFRLLSKWQGRLNSYMHIIPVRDKPSRFGCSWMELRAHIESLFHSGMTWENYGELWQVDHVFPRCKFDIPREIFSCFHYTNLRPRSKALNQLDGSKLGKGGKNRFSLTE